MFASHDDPDGHFWRRVVIVVSAITLLGLLLYFFEDWRGKRAWKNYRAELVANGVVMDPTAHLPAKAPAELNFAETPVLKHIHNRGGGIGGGWIGFGAYPTHADESGFTDLEQSASNLQAAENAPARNGLSASAYILKVFERNQSATEELRSAALLPHSQLRVEMTPQMQLSIPNFVAIRTLVQQTAVQASALIAEGRGDEALADLSVIHQMAEALRPHPTLVSVMVRIALLDLETEIIREGIARDVWSDEQLDEIETRLGQFNLLADFDRGLNIGERAAITYLVENSDPQALAASLGGGSRGKYLMAASPDGWISQGLIVFHQAYDQLMLRAYDPKAKRITPGEVATTEEMMAFIQKSGIFGGIARMGIPNISKALEVVGRRQTMLDCAMLSCAIQRFYHATGAYPETLQALKPEYVQTLPHDVVTGDPLFFERRESGYVLYSVGWNGKNDAGKSEDWVWRIPAPSKSE